MRHERGIMGEKGESAVVMEGAIRVHLKGKEQREPHREADQRLVVWRLQSTVTTTWREGVGWLSCDMELGEMRVGEATTNC